MDQLTRRVIFDTDCLCSFLWVEREDIVINLYEGLIVIPDEVHKEISKVPHLFQRLNQLIINKKVVTQSIFYGTKEYELYKEMTVSPVITKKIIGKGEASAIALCITNNGILASNNIRDIKEYVSAYDLDTLFTTDILFEAYNKKIISLEEGKDIYQKMLDKRRRLPYKSFEELLDSLSIKV